MPDWRDTLISTLKSKNIFTKYKFKKRDRGILDPDDILILDDQECIQGTIKEGCGGYYIEKDIFYYAKKILYFNLNNCKVIEQFIEEG